MLLNKKLKLIEFYITKMLRLKLQNNDDLYYVVGSLSLIFTKHSFYELSRKL